MFADHKRECKEIALMGGLGAAGGLAVALIMDVNIFLSVFIGLTGFTVFYKPLEPLTAMYNTAAAWLHLSRKNAAAIRKECWNTFCTVLACISMSIPGMLFAMLIVQTEGMPVKGGIAATVYSVVLIAGTSWIMGLVFYGLGLGSAHWIALEENKDGSETWLMPLMRRASVCRIWPFQRYGLKINPQTGEKELTAPDWHTWTTAEQLIFVTIKVPIYQLFGLTMFMVMGIDMLLSAFIILTHTKRLAMCFGIALGCLAGSILYVNGEIHNPFAIILFGWVIGTFSGPSIYLATLYLSAPVSKPQHETIMA